jgi:hypothetical protein
MVEWGPSEVTEAVIQRMEEDGLASENALVVGWHPPTIGALAPMLDDHEIVSFTDLH